MHSISESKICVKILHGRRRMKFVISDKITKRFAWWPVTLNDGGRDDGKWAWMETYYMYWCRQRGRVHRASKRDGELSVEIRLRVQANQGQ